MFTIKVYCKYHPFIVIYYYYILPFVCVCVCVFLLSFSSRQYVNDSHYTLLLYIIYKYAGCMLYYFYYYYYYYYYYYHYLPL